jgi:hypothetical protein
MLTPRKEITVTAVAEEAPAIPAADQQLLDEAAEDIHTVVREWTRTPEQTALVHEYLQIIDEQYTRLNADPRLVALLTDMTIIGTPEMCELLGYEKTTRAFQLYTKRRRLAEADQVPHPSAVPEADANGGRRGPREIRGLIRGRMLHWMLQSCRFRWDPIVGAIVPQTGINAGGAPKTKERRS